MGIPTGEATSCSPAVDVYVVGAVTTFYLYAGRPSAASPTAGCFWIAHTPFSIRSDVVSIVTADGLPVELMEFSIIHEDESGESKADGATSENDDE